MWTISTNVTVIQIPSAWLNFFIWSVDLWWVLFKCSSLYSTPLFIHFLPSSTLLLAGLICRKESVQNQSEARRLPNRSSSANSGIAPADFIEEIKLRAWPWTNPFPECAPLLQRAQGKAAGACWGPGHSVTQLTYKSDWATLVIQGYCYCASITGENVEPERRYVYPK